MNKTKVNVNIKRLSVVIGRFTKLYEYSFRKEHPQSIKLAQKKNVYPFIPSTPNYLINVYNILNVFKIKKTAKIIDAGCGLSPILLFLDILGYKNLYGIDRIKQHIVDLESILHRSIIIVNDITEHNYSEYDVIYSYMPISNHSVYKDKFRNKVIEEMKSGSIFIDFFGPITEDTEKYKDKIEIFHYDCIKVTPKNDITKPAIIRKL